ncbi:MAG: hypothetical protein IJG68_01110 [Bacilli bacterium]|nr:hypothetical protein [Bacilli bacterium]
MFDSYTEPATVARDIIRLLFSTLDRPFYALLGIIYQLFFNVASADLFSNELIMKFYGRVQIILGVFMMFQLVMTILRGIVNPDSFTKDKGAGTLITRVVTALIIMTLLIPISTSGRNEYERQINNNGLLFGTLYSLQHRILSNNTIGRLVLGTNDDSMTFSDEANSSGDTDLKKSSRIFTSTIVKGFYRINLIPEDQRTNRGDGKDPAVYNENRVCKDIDDDILAAYTRIDAEPGEIIGMVTATCDSDASPGFLNSIWTGAKKLTGSTKYVFAYTPVVSTIVPIVFIFILLSFTIDVAVRAVKLAVLRLIAPIPIIAYMDPKGSKDSAFNAWVKALVSTYLDLFIRLASVYFVIFIIQDMVVNGVGISTTSGSGFLHTLSAIIIWIGLFIFAKQAPKFIKQVLGLKDDGGKIFSGFGEIGTALGIGASIPGAIGSGIASARASRMSDETRQAFGVKDAFGREIDPNSFLNRGKHLVSGIAGGLAGGFTGAAAAIGAKDHALNASLDAMRKRNADVIAKGGSGTTFLGRVGATAQNVVLGETTSDRLERDISSLETKQKALDAIKKRVSGEMVKMDWTKGSAKDGFVGHAGNSMSGASVSMNGKKFNYKQFVANMAEAQAGGRDYVTVTDDTGTQFTLRYADAEIMKGQILQNNENDYIQQVTAGKQADIELMSLIRDAEQKGAASDTMTNGKPRVIPGYTRSVKGRITTRNDYTKVNDSFAQEARELSRQNVVHKADNRFAAKK